MAVRVDVAAGVVVRVDLVGEDARGPERGSRSRRTSDRNVRSGRKPVTTMTSSTSVDLLAVDRGEGQPAVGLGASTDSVRNWVTLVTSPLAAAALALLAELAALLELVVVAAAERVPDGRAAQQPRHAGGRGRSWRAWARPIEDALGGGALAGDGDVLAAYRAATAGSRKSGMP